MSLGAGDTELARRAAIGDRGAFEALIRRHSAGLHAFCRRLVGEEADDRVQEAFLRAYQNLHRYDPSRRFATWLYAIARNLCIDLLRKRKAWGPLPELPDPVEAPPFGPDEREALDAAIAELPPKHRAVLHHKYALGLSAPEIARELDMSPGNVRVCLHRAIRSLRARLSR